MNAWACGERACRRLTSHTAVVVASTRSLRLSAAIPRCCLPGVAALDPGYVKRCAAYLLHRLHFPSEQVDECLGQRRALLPPLDQPHRRGGISVDQRPEHHAVDADAPERGR